MIGRRRNSLEEPILRLQEELASARRERKEELRAYAEEVRVRSEESRAAIEESKVAIEESRAAIEESKAAIEESREFNREILLRNEKVYTHVIARLERLGERMDAGTAQLRENTEETRAQTKALLRLLDRFDGPSGMAAA